MVSCLLEHNICSVAVNSSTVHFTLKYNILVTSFMLLYLEKGKYTTEEQNGVGIYKNAVQGTNTGWKLPLYQKGVTEQFHCSYCVYSKSN